MFWVSSSREEELRNSEEQELDVSAQNIKHTNTPPRSEGGANGGICCAAALKISSNSPQIKSARVCLLPYIWMCVKAPDQARCLHALI